MNSLPTLMLYRDWRERRKRRAHGDDIVERRELYDHISSPEGSLSRTLSQGLLPCSSSSARSF